MKHSKVGNLMTNDVVSVLPRASFKDVAHLLAVHGISGLPVVDEDDKVVGVISESDLVLRRLSAPARRERRPRLPWPGRDTGAGAAHTRGPTAEGLMSHPAITVHADDSIVDAARTMAGRRVERLPVVDEEERLVGIVTRRDLLQVFLRPDPDIRRDVIADVIVNTMWLSPRTLDVRVADGVVTLKGQVERRSEIPVLLRLTRAVDGVVAVVEELTYRVDDARPQRPAEQTLLGLAEE